MQITDMILSLFSYEPLLIVLWGGGFIFFIVFIVIYFEPKNEVIKSFFFILISLIALVITADLVIDTLRLVGRSFAKGPVHRHADFRIFNCGEEVALKKPKGLSNRIGSPLVHEHGDKRIHIEGIPETEEVASLKNFMREIGGHLDESTLRVPSEGRMLEIKNGDACGEGAGALNVFVWQTKDSVARQIKLTTFSDYLIAPEAQVPPGDCIIFDFDTPKDRTEYICEQYEVAEKRGDIIISDL